MKSNHSSLRCFVSCDKCDATSPRLSTMREARHLATFLGWSFSMPLSPQQAKTFHLRGVYHLCPSCVKDYQRPQKFEELGWPGRSQQMDDEQDHQPGPNLVHGDRDSEAGIIAPH